MIKDTAYNLEIRLQRIEDCMSVDSAKTVEMSVDLQDEREVTRQCVRICQDAQSYIDSLQNRQPSLRREAAPTANIVQEQFDAELMTSRTLIENKDNLVQTISRLQARLAALMLDEGPNHDRQMLRLQDDIRISKQCLEVCKEASSQVHYRKIHTIGEVMADNDTDQLVVTTLADLFDVRKVLAKDRSAQLVGSMTDETLQKVSASRYASRFGTVTEESVHVRTCSDVAPSNLETREGSTRRLNPTMRVKQPANGETRYEKPSPNEVRKRATEGEGSATKGCK